MITLITGENSFENERALQKVARSFEGGPERVDGTELALSSLPDLLMGGTLFAQKRLVIIRRLSENKTVWNEFVDWLPRVDEDIHLVLVEPTLDKRTKTYKALQKNAEILSSILWSERDTTSAERWLVTETGRLGIALDKKSTHTLLERTGYDQWTLMHALEKLAVMDSITPRLIEGLVDASPSENVFLLFEKALRGDSREVKEMLKTLAMTEDAYRLLGLLAGQATQLSVSVVSSIPSAEVAKDIGVHPFALSKLAPFAKKLGRSGVKEVLVAIGEADEMAKTSAIDPWILIEQSLLKIAQIK